MDDSARIQFAVFAELRILSDVAVRVDDTAVSDLSAFFDDAYAIIVTSLPIRAFSLMTAVSWIPGSHLFSGRNFDEFAKGAAGIGDDDQILRVVVREFIDRMTPACISSMCSA